MAGVSEGFSSRYTKGVISWDLTLKFLTLETVPGAASSKMALRFIS
jgi:hypothetical protein